MVESAEDPVPAHEAVTSELGRPARGTFYGNGFALRIRSPARRAPFPFAPSENVPGDRGTTGTLGEWVNASVLAAIFKVHAVDGTVDRRRNRSR